MKFEKHSPGPLTVTCAWSRQSQNMGWPLMRMCAFQTQAHNELFFCRQATPGCDSSPNCRKYTWIQPPRWKCGYKMPKSYMSHEETGQENVSESQIQQQHLPGRTLAGKVDAGCWAARREISAHFTVKQNLKWTVNNVGSLFMYSPLDC